MKKLASYWQTDYDWRKGEARLNVLPQFATNIAGLDIHFVQIRSNHQNALPVIITHGWPGSIIEQLKIIDPLTNPTAHGGNGSDAYDVVIPSLPGQGFSERPATTGWDPVRIAGAWIVFMRRLAYTRFVAPGGDWGRCSLGTDGGAGISGIARRSHSSGVSLPTNEATLTGNRSVRDRGATNVAQIVISGKRRQTPRGAIMVPAFGLAYSDIEIAAVADHVAARFRTKAFPWLPRTSPRFVDGSAHSPRTPETCHVADTTARTNRRPPAPTGRGQVPRHPV